MEILIINPAKPNIALASMKYHSSEQAKSSLNVLLEKTRLEDTYSMLLKVKNARPKTMTIKEFLTS